MDSLSELIAITEKFIEESDDDEAVDLIAALYETLIDLASTCSILRIENKLLLRDLDDESQEDSTLIS